MHPEDGKLVWVVLEHSGLQWLKNMDGSAGYIVVSASVSDVTLVTDYKSNTRPTPTC